MVWFTSQEERCERLHNLHAAYGTHPIAEDSYIDGRVVHPPSIVGGYN